MMRTGLANLPLHGGSCPKWLFPRMRKLAGEITEAIVLEFGSDEFLRRISDTFFFQSLGCVIGYDWHSSGVSTTTTAAIKEGIAKKNLGIKVCGGKGATSRKTPVEIENFGSEFGLSTKNTERLKYSSRMAAKTDSVLVQDGYQLYHHSFFLTETGNWAVVQQGLNDSNGYARRYHWLSDNVQSFVNEPHAAICGGKENNVLNMTAKESEETRKTSVDIVNDNPQHLRKYVKNPHPQLRGLQQRQLLLTEFNGRTIETLNMPRHEPILSCDLTEKTLKQLQIAYEIQPENYEELVSLRGIGSKSIRALALVSELVYGCRASWKDPVKFSFALGGKDGYPYAVDRSDYDKTVEIIKVAVENAKLGEKDRLNAIRRLNDFLKPLS